MDFYSDTDHIDGLMQERRNSNALAQPINMHPKPYFLAMWMSLLAS